jgi:tripartite-type tricarboxylate transporter receptor subunit TctC
VNFARNIAAATASLVLATTAIAQSYPSRPLRLVSGTQAGGITSVQARMFGDELAQHLRQPVVVEEKPGAANMIAARLVMGAAADGYTLHVGGINPHPLLEKNGIDLSREMEPVGIISSVPMVFVTTATLPLDTVRAVADFATANPGRLDFGSSGGGAHWNLMMTLFARRAGGFSHSNVPYKGAPDIQLALGRGDIQISMLTPPSIVPLIASGKARAILIAAPSRSPLLPNVPTPAEAGLRPFSASTDMYLWAPRGTPREVIEKLNAAMVAIAKDRKYSEAVMSKTGAAPLALTPDEALAHFTNEVQQLREALGESGSAGR